MDKATAGQCLQEVLPYLCGPDAVDDRVEAARKEQVHDAEENANGCRETVPDPIGQESGEYDGQADSHDHDVGDTGVQSFDTWFAWTYHRAEYDYVRGGDEAEVSHRDQEHRDHPHQAVDGGASTGQLHQGHVLTETVI